MLNKLFYFILFIIAAPTARGFGYLIDIDRGKRRQAGIKRANQSEVMDSESVISGGTSNRVAAATAICKRIFKIDIRILMAREKKIRVKKATWWNAVGLEIL